MTSNTMFLSVDSAKSHIYKFFQGEKILHDSYDSCVCNQDVQTLTYILRTVHRSLECAVN
jgi:hypothetical protein